MPTWVFDTSCIGVKSWGSSPLPSSLYVWWLVGVDGEGWEVMCSGMETETTLLYPPSFSGWIVTKAAGCGAMAPGSPEERAKMSWCPSIQQCSSSDDYYTYLPERDLAGT